MHSQQTVANAFAGSASRTEGWRCCRKAHNAPLCHEAGHWGGSLLWWHPLLRKRAPPSSGHQHQSLRTYQVSSAMLLSVSQLGHRCASQKPKWSHVVMMANIYCVGATINPYHSHYPCPTMLVTQKCQGSVSQNPTPKLYCHHQICLLS